MSAQVLTLRPPRRPSSDPHARLLDLEAEVSYLGTDRAVVHRYGTGEKLVLARIPLVYRVDAERPRANHQLLESFSWRGAPRHLVALPDWSPALRGSAREKPLGARVAALPQLQLFEEAS